MKDKEIQNFFQRLSLIISVFKDAENMCTEVVNLIAPSSDFKRAVIIMKGWHGEFHTMAVSGGARGERIELKHIRCHDDITKFIMDGMKDKNTIVVDFLPKELCSSEITADAIVSPITSKGKEMGVLIAETDEADEMKVQLIDSAARYVSMGLENHTIYTEWMENRIEMTHEIETLQLMYEIGKEILSNLNAEEIIETVVLMIRRIIPCDGVSMAVVADDDGNALKVTASWGTGMDKGEKMGNDVPFFAILNKGKSFYQNDITLDFKKSPALLKWAEGKHVYSYFCAPLMIKDKLFGAFILSSVRPAWLTNIHIAIIEKVATQVGIALENAKLMEDLEEVFMGTIKSLIAAIDAKSQWTKGHSDRVVNYSYKIGEKLRLNKDTMERLQLAAILHDVGKIGTYEAVLDKAGKLTPEEMEMIRKHPAQGAEILMPLKGLRNIIPIMKHHHERYDGTGYPDGLAGDDIPLEARILALADVYDAMKSDRPYREGLTKEAAMEELKNGAGTQFDPALVRVFTDILNQG
ncbi:MAG TPA: hypothetical protein DHV16_03925 [Nitrospiraceae bacterium]|nr:MAG: hypothetical protein A2Z82_09475 [Nitrospirae bacterium GWA2_46_11]OGW24116.1 MAG: hypothetical protein A2X55_10425 [Nitrospirae bacterium GWB2_47_37]HAK88186.1 hypothetical protein [Nitrospiraceae bacterium]HCZ11404.1 hypothetical protein [Nitrospiraceae bacterium]